MKITKIFLFSLILISLSENIFSSEETEMWRRLYDQAYTFNEKREVIKSLKNKANSEFSDLIFQILVEQSNYSYKYHESRDYENLVLETASIAGKLKIEKAAEYLVKIFEKTKTPIIKGELLSQIGNTGNKRYLVWLNDLFKVTNTQHKDKGLQGNEEIIYGLILGVGNFSDESSFEDLLYAANPHYSKKIQELANTTIKKITNDPTSLCNEIIINNPDYELKIDALNYALKSDAPKESKTKTCKLTINKIQWSEVPFQIKEKKIELLNKAVYYLGEIRANDSETIEIIEKKWDNETDFYSILIDVEALKKIGSEGSAKVLIKKLKKWNDLKKQGGKTGYLTEDGYKHVIAVIQALGEIQYRGSLEILYDTTWTESYGNIIKSEALKAIDKIMNTTK